MSDKTRSENDGRRRQGRLQRRLIIRLARLSQDLERFNMAEYISLLNNPRRYILVNFTGGIARGLGFAVGATLLAALLVYIMQRLVLLNLPLIGDFIAELVRIVNEQLKG
ncbi:MAG TPA: DUF5665 domain-containing protein [Bacillota bacterium]|nr:DUF5665 domain-containing protein [Bacillota bacterium]HOJ84667.1 DUF5665 domain-containing protein [Bacillota bacterium]HOL15727.1 DUF5665 domain-containing protein [Bacillota bacterium]HPZ12581.1 DUF5665 domain-containing protein [Bacillota bacterium]HQE09478.1 DUF5665 domain-containing protein [Bacillota bacterium]